MVGFSNPSQVIKLIQDNLIKPSWVKFDSLASLEWKVRGNALISQTRPKISFSTKSFFDKFIFPQIWSFDYFRVKSNYTTILVFTILG